MPRFKLSNGVKVQFTAEEEAQRDAEEQAWSDDTHNRKMRSLREERNRLLSECDWTDLPNSALTEEKKNEWKTYKNNLLVNRALNFNVKYKPGEEIRGYTHAKALSNGWLWEIPTQERLGCGYVFSDNHITKE